MEDEGAEEQRGTGQRGREAERVEWWLERRGLKGGGLGANCGG